MNVILALVFDYDAADWAREYDLPQADAAGDFAAVLRRAVDDGGIRHALDTAWPMMRGHATVHTLDGLDATLRDTLLHELQDAHDADHETALLAAIRDHLATIPHELYRREPRWVIFHTDEWDNGHFLTGTAAEVYFPDGDSVEVDFDGSCVDDLLTDAYGTRGSSAALGVDLHTGAVDFDDFGDNVPDLLGIPAHDHHDGDGCANYDTDYTVIRDGDEVAIADLRDGDVFIDCDDKPWMAARVGRDGPHVHVDIQPATAATSPAPKDPGPASQPAS
ncbi:hypothetical protein [Dactylosporangium sp. CA-092794]|uniref:hypothetical protein n=1 Tax=Dactylosporangium sp. CA-092794 TaxID=3239929 RepID=UPI003D90ED40